MRLKTNHVEDVKVFDLLKEQKTLKGFEQVQFIYIFSHWYKENRRKDVNIADVRSNFIHQIPTMQSSHFVNLLTQFKVLCSKCPDLINFDLFQCFLNKLHSLEIDQKISAAKELTNFQELFLKFKISPFETFQSLLNPELIKSSSKSQLFKLFKISTICFNKMTELELEEIMDAFEMRIEKDLNDLMVHEKLTCLSFLLTCNRKTETLLRKIESFVFPNLKMIQITEFTNIMNFYLNRNLKDYHYLMNSIYKPLYLDFLERGHMLEKVHLINYLKAWKKVANAQGMYCDEKLISKLDSLLDIHKLSKGINEEEVNTLISILSISNLCGLFSNKELNKKIIKTLEGKLDSLGVNLFVPLAHEVSLNPGISPEFWKIFTQRFSYLLKDIRKTGYLYGIYLNLKLQDEEAFEIVKDEYNKHLNSIKKSWLDFRKMVKPTLFKGKFHASIEEVLKSMKIEYESEAFDEYFIDIACPKEKLAIEVLGPGHYIFPYSFLNGKTKNKKKNLEKLGWTYLEIPFHLKSISMKIIKGNIQSKISLNNL